MLDRARLPSNEPCAKPAPEVTSVRASSPRRSRPAAGVVTAGDGAILDAMGRLIRKLRVIVEPGGAAGLAAVLADRRFHGCRVGVVLSGGNASYKPIRQLEPVA